MLFWAGEYYKNYMQVGRCPGRQALRSPVPPRAAGTTLTTEGKAKGSVGTPSLQATTPYKLPALPASGRGASRNLRLW